MQHQQLRKLAGAANVEELQGAIEAYCRPFGSPRRIRLLPVERQEACVCFLELSPPNLNSRIIEDLGGFYFANGVAFLIPCKLPND